MAFQSSAFQVDAFQQTDPSPAPAVEQSGGGWTSWAGYEPDEALKDRVHFERVRMGILPADAVKAVAKVTVDHDLSNVQYLHLLDLELKAVGAEMNAAYIKQFERALAKKRADDDDEEAIGLLI
jgi:hypothetical protein